MAHCDAKMTNHVGLTPPRSSTTAIFSHDSLPAGKGLGLGCSSNRKFAACSFQDASGNNLIFYNADGVRTWSSGSLLNASAYASAPLISQDGDVIAADDTRLVRLDSAGKIIWNTLTPGGIPISPVITESGAIVLATYHGPISAFDSGSGKLLGSLTLYNSSGTSYFDTVNTPCVRQNRLYISMQIENDTDNIGALVAIDLNTANAAQPLTVAWSFSFGSPSGASPLCVANTIYFDGASRYPGQTANPQVFAVQDKGDSASLLWNVSVPSVLPANLGLDPRGGVWAMFKQNGIMERFDTKTGEVIGTLNIGALVGGTQTNYPYSAITMAGSKTDPVMLLGTRNSSITSSHVIAVDLPSSSLLWSVEIAPAYGNDDAPAQFPILWNSSGDPVVVFAGRKSGAYFVAAPNGE